MYREEIFKLRCIDGSLLYINTDAVSRSSKLIKLFEKELGKQNKLYPKFFRGLINNSMDKPKLDITLQTITENLVYDLGCSRTTGELFVEYLNGFQNEELLLKNTSVRGLYKFLKIDTTDEEIIKREERFKSLNDKITAHAQTLLEFNMRINKSNIFPKKYKKELTYGQSGDLLNTLEEELTELEKIDFEWNFDLHLIKEDKETWARQQTEKSYDDAIKYIDQQSYSTCFSYRSGKWIIEFVLEQTLPPST